MDAGLLPRWMLELTRIELTDVAVALETSLSGTSDRTMLGLLSFLFFEMLLPMLVRLQLKEKGKKKRGGAGKNLLL